MLVPWRVFFSSVLGEMIFVIAGVINLPHIGGMAILRDMPHMPFKMHFLVLRI